MKKLIIGMALAISLMLGIAGSAAATGPDESICDHANTAAITVIVTTLGFTCDAHGPP